MLASSQGLAMGFSSQEPAKKARTEEKTTCLPVTIRSIEIALQQNAGAGSEVQFYGQEFSMLVLVAQVESVTKQAASWELSLNDATGRIKARYYVADDLGPTEVVPRQYISTFGHVRTQPTTHFAMTGMQAIESANEISFHMIESAHAALKLQRAQTEPGKVPMLPSGTSPKKASTPQKEAAAALQGAALQAAVSEYLQKESGDRGEQGVSVEEICQRLTPASKADVQEALQSLVLLGDAFATCDNDHFASIA